MNNPLVSVIIPAFNSRQFIEETINSVLQQSYRFFEILVIDDGSVDRLEECAGKFVKADSRVSYFYQENQGVSAARNFGYSRSAGTYVAFLDADDVWMPENLMLKLQKFENGNYGLVHSDAILINEKSEPIGKMLAGKEGFILNDLLSWNGTQIPGPSSILVRRDVMEAVGLFDLKLSTSADQDLFFRIASKYRIGRVPTPTWKYRMHNRNMHKNIKLMENNVLYVYQKAMDNQLFHTTSFKRKCFARMYLILAASWSGDGRNISRALYFLIRSFMATPMVFIQSIIRKIIKWLTK